MNWPKSNSIKIYRTIDGFTIVGYALYLPTVDGWECTVRDHYGREDVCGPEQTGNDAWATLQDMIDIAIEASREYQTAANAV